MMKYILEETSIAPCNECKSYEHCALHNTACIDFDTYVHTGKLINNNRMPWKLIYKSIFRGNRKIYGRT